MPSRFRVSPVRDSGRSASSPGTVAAQLSAKGNVKRTHVTLTVLFAAAIITSFGALSYPPWGDLLKSAYVTGIRKLSQLKRGQIVRLTGSGAAVVDDVWSLGGEYFGRFRCQDGLVVLLTEAEEAIIATLTKLSAAD